MFLMGLLLLALQPIAQPNFPQNPQEAEIIYSDLVHFIDAYEELAADKDTIAVLNALYFDRGSAGLKEFISRHQLSPEMMKEAMAADPERYALLPDFLINIHEVEALYHELMIEYGKVMPEAMYPPTYLLVGANRGIGQASLVGQLVTVTRPVDSMEKLKKLMVHELSHFQQAMAMGGQNYVALYAAPDNMLGLCLREGGAEFIAYLAVNDVTQRSSLDYLENNEDRLKDQFLQDLETQNKDFWLWESLEQSEHPSLLGYAMGFKVCKHYYDQSSDKTFAMQQILKMEDAEAFLSSSGYFER